MKGGRPGDAKAQGQFCLVSLTVKDTSNEGHSFGRNNAMAYDAAGTAYRPDFDDFDFDLDARVDFFEAPVQPGGTITGIIVFDIPKGVTIDRLTIDESLLPGAATIKFDQ